MAFEGSIKDASDPDVDAITDIYNHAVLHTTAIWNETTVDRANRLTWLRDRQDAGFPVRVAVAPDGAVAGYASFGDWRAWDGYRHTVEHSVYVDPDHQGQGIGKALMLDLIDQARAQGKHVMIAGIEAENTASIRLHETLGFEEVGHLKEVGRKFDTWLDLVFLQLTLGTQLQK